jgi:hypothetical protein
MPITFTIVFVSRNVQFKAGQSEERRTPEGYNRYHGILVDASTRHLGDFPTG